VRALLSVRALLRVRALLSVRALLRALTYIWLAVHLVWMYTQCQVGDGIRFSDIQTYPRFKEGDEM